MPYALFSLAPPWERAGVRGNVNEQANIYWNDQLVFYKCFYLIERSILCS